MIPRLLADAVLIVHGLFVAFVVFGGLLTLWRWRLAYLHLPALAWGAMVIGMGWICPLTPLEVSLRQQAGQQGYAGGFIEHYILAVIYPDGLTRAASRSCWRRCWSPAICWCTPCGRGAGWRRDAPSVRSDCPIMR